MLENKLTQLGLKNYCNLCDKKSIFNDFGGRKQVHCPNCRSLERHRLQWIYIQENTDILNSKTAVLQVAPEKLLYEIFKENKNVDVTGIDIEPNKRDLENEIIQGDVTKLKFKDNSFDVVICNHVFEHIKEDEKAMSEIYRVLKPGGFAILDVPVDYSRKETFEDWSVTTPEERTKVFGQHDHIRIYGLDYFDKLKKAGYKVSEDSSVQDKLSARLFKKLSLTKRPIIIGRK